MKKLDKTATILENSPCADGFYKMKFAIEEMPERFKPGQFFQMQLPNHILRRPFAPSEVTKDTITFVYQVVGSGTNDMAKLSVGTQVNVLGPLGNGFELPKSGDVFVVGGGCGMPSLLFLTTVLRKNNINVYAVSGARTRCALLESEGFHKTAVSLLEATDDGTAGYHGNAVNALNHLYETVKHSLSSDVEIMACGPRKMLEALSKWSSEHNFRCQVSLEERMACGFGACMGCVVGIRSNESNDDFKYERVCHEGPVFLSDRVIW